MSSEQMDLKESIASNPKETTTANYSALADAVSHQHPYRQSRRRVLSVLGLIAALMLFRHPAVLSGAAGCLLLWLLWFGQPLRSIVSRMLLIIPFALGTIVLVPFQHPDGGTALLHVGGWTATEEGARHALVLLLKIICANLLLTYLILSTPVYQLIASLRAIGMPAVLLEMTVLMLRYTGLLREEARGMLHAQRARGLQIRDWRFKRRTWHRLGELLGVLFVRAYSRSGRIYQSIAARGGFGGSMGNGSHLRSRCRSGTIDADPSNPSNPSNPINSTNPLHLLKEGEAMTSAIEVREVTFHYGNRQALNGLSFSIGQGAKVALMGPNGAGKSTLIALLNGLEQPSAGEVAIFGKRISSGNAHLLRTRVGVVYQDPDDQIFSPTVGEDVAFGPRNLGLDELTIQQRVTEALHAVGLDGFDSRSPFELSYGQKRRVAIAGVLAMKPDVIVLDEPMAFLDPKSRDQLQQLLEKMHEEGLTVMVATHDVDFAAEWATDVLMMKEGQLLASGTPELLFDAELLSGADLHLPRLVRPFRLLKDQGHVQPRTVQDAAQAIWQLVMRGGEALKLRSANRMDGETRQREG
ncbi:cobalt ECF transporter T component CbiQ [Paenibacillus sp. PR3]|uniref:Cobalt ECF transporter T component CbiQ n=1 Tax=Paenibacillus terricola TaxID=2763503 RepID=A0ABR8N3P1_9BACL|nr:cobalt ECF transporter T component CbiQ [Paenibacillus terricola]MBD3922790.1 cobalt ECF transporter T component CbiQ [Paenibacillus terricola]